MTSTRTSLTACRTCQQQVATDATACPGCGTPSPAGPPAFSWDRLPTGVQVALVAALIVCLAAFLILAAAGLLFG